MEKYAKKNISAKQPSKSEEARISGENGYSRGTQRNKTSSLEGSQKTDTVSLVKLRFPKENRLRKRNEFQRVYAKGRRIKGRFMTAFILPSETSFQRIGVTATKKAVGNAVRRNRSKRLLREVFRLSKLELCGLGIRYDWVLNARKSLLAVKLEEPLEEFRQIVAEVREIELEINKGE